ncbi:hypothetical protein [Achromobacter aegrifaciens]|uniref:hypothetical protein n=1 Tax=Achromobacter aegrifaciens TaxID=1287736 RepID=UPI000F73CBF0|nr:hypothetical protein [Achromobacter aegrifaciens]RSF09284.1 hypothetical protein EGU54_00170 [Achromobacter aegrifaciens]
MTSHTSSTLRISPHEYRQFAEIAKASGMVLRLFKQPAQIIGLASGMDVAVIDATRAEIVGSLVEAPSLLLCEEINAGSIRRGAHERFECDVSQISDAEMYRFWLFHEIGHRADNYCSLSFQLSDTDHDPDNHRGILDRIWRANEILADRWAWAQVCDRPMPLNHCGTQNQDAIAAELEFLDRVTGGRKNYARPWVHVNPGQYCGVPMRMLARNDAHAWVGADVAPEVKARACEYEERASRHPERHFPESLMLRANTARACASNHDANDLQLEAA